jgi:hypothetical protein
MVASCHRRMLAYARALELYEEIHVSHPDNVECLRYLVALCKDLGRRSDQYEGKLLRLERTAAQTSAAGGALTRVGGGGGGYDDGGGQQQYGGGGAGGYAGGDEPMGALDQGGQSGGGYGGGGPDLGYGSSADRFAAPNVVGHMESAGGRAVRDEETFADAGEHVFFRRVCVWWVVVLCGELSIACPPSICFRDLSLDRSKRSSE